MQEKISWDLVEEEQLNPSIKRKMIWGKKVMVARMELKDGCLVPKHHHDND